MDKNSSALCRILYKWNHTVHILAWLLSLSIIILDPSKLLHVSTVHGVSLPSGIPLYRHTAVCTPTHPLMGAVYFPSAAYEPHCCVHSRTSFCVDVVSFLLGKHLGVERLERVVGTRVTFSETAKLCPGVVTH